MALERLFSGAGMWRRWNPVAYKSSSLPVALARGRCGPSEVFGVARRRFLPPLTPGRKSGQQKCSALCVSIPKYPLAPEAELITSDAHVFPVDAH